MFGVFGNCRVCLRQDFLWLICDVCGVLLWSVGVGILVVVGFGFTFALWCLVVVVCFPGRLVRTAMLLVLIVYCALLLSVG